MTNTTDIMPNGAPPSQTVHNAATLCERSTQVDIDFQAQLPALRVARCEVAVDDIVTLRCDEETLLVAVRTVASTGLLEGKIIGFGAARATHRDMRVGDAIVFQSRHVFACAAPSAAGLGPTSSA